MLDNSGEAHGVPEAHAPRNGTDVLPTAAPAAGRLSLEHGEFHNMRTGFLAIGTPGAWTSAIQSLERHVLPFPIVTVRVAPSRYGA